MALAVSLLNEPPTAHLTHRCSADAIPASPPPCTWSQQVKMTEQKVQQDAAECGALVEGAQQIGAVPTHPPSHIAAPARHDPRQQQPPLPGYDSFWCCCQTKSAKGFNGVTTYARKGLTVRGLARGHLCCDASAPHPLLTHRPPSRIDLGRRRAAARARAGRRGTSNRHSARHVCHCQRLRPQRRRRQQAPAL